MGQQILNDQPGIVLVAADADFHRLAALQRHHAVQLQRHGHPLIFADAAVIMGLQIGQLAVLVQRRGLQIQTGRIDVRAADLHAAFQTFAADDRQKHRLAAVDAVDLIPCLQLLAAHKRTEARLFRLRHRFHHTLAFGLARVQKMLIALAVGFAAFFFRRADAPMAVFRRIQQRLGLILFLRHIPVSPFHRS